MNMLSTFQNSAATFKMSQQSMWVASVHLRQEALNYIQGSPAQLAFLEAVGTGSGNSLG